MKICKNEELVKKKSFIITKENDDEVCYFKAFLQKGATGKDRQLLSELNAIQGGHCNDVITKPESQQCGMATTLMEFCFTDDDVGGVDLEEDPVFGMEIFEKWLMIATKNCKHIVYLECEPHLHIPNEACSAYLTAAINTEHIMVFTKPNAEEEMHVMNVATKVKPELKKDADAFVRKYGEKWYFCECKPETVEQCKAMDSEKV